MSRVEHCPITVPTIFASLVITLCLSGLALMGAYLSAQVPMSKLFSVVTDERGRPFSGCISKP